MDIPSDWEPVEIDSFPKYQRKWIHRILGYEDWEKPNRDLEKIEQEYNKEKYGSLLSKFENTQPSWEEVKYEQLPDDKHTIVSSNGDLYETSTKDVYLKGNERMLGEISEYLTGGETIVELGSGYGANLGYLFSELNHSFPDIKYIGGEYSDNAVELGNKIFGQNRNITIKKFNYYSDEWDIIRELENKNDVIVFTRHSIEQLPNVGDIIENIEYMSECINRCIHFEPVYELHPQDSLLGLLRRRYTEINDYNTDIYSELTDLESISVVDKEYDDIGANPLNTTSILQWI